MTPWVSRAALAALVALAIGSSGAFAHAPVKSTSITDGAALDRAPASFTLEFANEAVLVEISVSGGDGLPVALDYVPPEDMEHSFIVPLPALGPGSYAITWRTMASDGHVMEAAIRFSVAGR